MFALGCAGTAFAVEQEEGTFEFLRTIPVSARQVLIGKLLVAALATIAMYLLLNFTASRMFGSEPTRPLTIKSRVSLLLEYRGVWFTAALEAIAWGTFFSLICARPLVAICLAMTAGSTVAYILAWKYAASVAGFSLSAYAGAAPQARVRIGTGTCGRHVLGLRWLKSNAP